MARRRKATKARRCTLILRLYRRPDKRKLLARIADPISPDLEIAAVTDRACKAPGGGPALLFEKPSGFDIPVASNIFGSLERMCLALGVAKLDDLAEEIDRLMTPPKPSDSRRAQDADDAPGRLLPRPRTPARRSCGRMARSTNCRS
jgi:4-hydroxy-3-polyprenylbenzoate decarboxylase